MRVERIKEKLEEILKNTDFSVYSVKTKREFGEKVLEILIKGLNIDSEILTTIHQQLYDKLEEGDLDDDYFMELSSRGAEYALESIEEIIEHLGGYVALETNKFKAIGTILDVTDRVITLEYNNKGQFRKVKIEYDDVLKIRTSVKI